jgi:hypothetical protein
MLFTASAALFLVPGLSFAQTLSRTFYVSAMPLGVVKYIGKFAVVK